MEYITESNDDDIDKEWAIHDSERLISGLEVVEEVFITGTWWLEVYHWHSGTTISAPHIVRAPPVVVNAIDPAILSQTRER